MYRRSYLLWSPEIAFIPRQVRATVVGDLLRCLSRLPRGLLAGQPLLLSPPGGFFSSQAFVLLAEGRVRELTVGLSLKPVLLFVAGAGSRNNRDRVGRVNIWLDWCT